MSVPRRPEAVQAALAGRGGGADFCGLCVLLCREDLMDYVLDRVGQHLPRADLASVMQEALLFALQRNKPLALQTLVEHNAGLTMQVNGHLFGDHYQCNTGHGHRKGCANVFLALFTLMVTEQAVLTFCIHSTDTGIT